MDRTTLVSPHPSKRQSRTIADRGRIAALAAVAGLAATGALAEPPAMCGTAPSATEVAALLALQNTGVYQQPPPESTASIGLTIHIVRRSNGTGGLAASQVGQIIDSANSAFLGSGIQFCRAGSVRFINSDTFYDIGNQAEADALRLTDVVPGTINVYLVNTLNAGSGALCGLSSFTTSPVQGILLANACATGGTGQMVVPHEIGHYFDLFHTHETAFGTECTNGSNCAIAGDLVCDTAADPGLSGQVSASCQWTGSAIPACGGLPYSPPTRNIMSYTSPTCGTEFTTFQNYRMLGTLFNFRPELNRNYCGPLPCYANCDQSATLPVLNVNDFTCFLNKFAAGDSYANCDASTTSPVLNVNDFTCFLNRFAAGCEARPDITVTIANAPPALAPGQVFDIAFDLRNDGAADLFGTIFVGAGLSLGDCIPENGNDATVGGAPFTIDPPLAPGAARRFVLRDMRAPLSGLALSIDQYLIVGADIQGPAPCRAICEENENNNTSCHRTPVLLTDLVVTSVTPPSPIPTSGENAVVMVRVKNVGGGYALGAGVTAQMSGGPVSSPPIPINLGPLESVDVPVTVLVGPSPGNCGAADPVPVSGCVNFPPDPTPANNCLQVIGQAHDPFWDLHVSITSAPGTGRISACTSCGPISWTIRVDNVGSVASPPSGNAGPVRVLSGITLNGQCFNWSNNLGQNVRDLPSIPAGGSYTYTVSGYEIPCGGTYLGTQFIKAEICNSGCSGSTPDLCLAGNCAPRRAIQIQLCPNP